MRDPARIGATVAGSASDRYPLIVLSPGNATNVEFYAALDPPAEPATRRGATLSR